MEVLRACLYIPLSPRQKIIESARSMTFKSLRDCIRIDEAIIF
ncbi:hypothetical protein ABI_12280 [Asticcacaulis biprosthecium C19]|uniref:Uncharacterized protein n=1 Tax=Asticcacaulis biprosthecium C19 TaxID=715226 RepID=F4QHQ3_9CAUL|nr:hypothetical protein ABI_12280 [Asticcacaulis biprosthecium C19]